MTSSAAAARDIPAPPAVVWQVLADFGNVASWFSGLKSSESVGDPAEGLGAQRRVHMVPMGSADEVITDWHVESRIAWSVGNIKSLPFKAGTTVVDLTPTDAGTNVEFALTAEPRGPRFTTGVTGALVSKILTRLLPQLLADLEDEALRRHRAA